MRLIDADAFLEKSIEERRFFIYHEDIIHGGFEVGTVYKDLIDAINEMPTIEAEPVIRCRDCAVPHNKWTGCPKLNGLVPPDNFYCAFGVRRDSDGKSG